MRRNRPSGRAVALNRVANARANARSTSLGRLMVGALRGAWGRHFYAFFLNKTSSFMQNQVLFYRKYTKKMNKYAFSREAATMRLTYK